MKLNGPNEPQVTFHDRRGFRNESFEPSQKYGVKADDMAAITARHFAMAQDRQAAADMNLLRAIAFGQALKRLAG